MWTSVAFYLGKSYFLRSRFNWLGCIIWKITYCIRLRHRNRVYRWGSTSPFPIPVSSDVMSYLFLIWSLLRLWVRPLVFVLATNFPFPFALYLFQMKGFSVLFWVLIDCRFAEMPPIVWKVFNVIFNFLISYRILANIAASGRLQELHQMNLTFARKTFWVVSSVSCKSIILIETCTGAYMQHSTQNDAWDSLSVSVSRHLNIKRFMTDINLVVP